MKNKRVCLLVYMVSILLILMSCSSNDRDLSAIDDSAEVMVISVEINPSVKLSVDARDKVLDYKLLNKDAEQLALDNIKGLDAVFAVEMIVAEAKKAGFINDEDLEEDYVLITSVPTNGDSKDVDNLGQRIKSHIKNSEALGSVNVAMIKANKIELREAEGKKVPVGFYVINGAINIDGTSMTVKEYFSRSDHAAKFKEKGEIVEKQHSKRIEQLERYLSRLEKKGYVVSKFIDRLSDTDLDVKGLIKEIRDFEKEFRKTNGNAEKENKGKSKGRND